MMLGVLINFDQRNSQFFQKNYNLILPILLMKYGYILNLIN